MSIFAKSNRRAIAPFVLTLWLFALLVSIAQACGLGDHLELASTASTSLHPNSGDETSPACIQFCADDHPVVTKLKALEESPGGSAPFILAPMPDRRLLASVRWTLTVIVPDPPPGIAVNTRFVRLAL